MTDRRGRVPAGVWWIAGGVVVVLVALATRYGWHRDELYFLEAGRHLAWGYVDQPPFAPFVARIADEIARHDLRALRVLPALATGVTVVMGAAFVRELGGQRQAQVLGAGVVAASGFVLGAGHILSTTTFDLTAWVAALWVAARLLRTSEPRWWLAFGAIAGVALLNKHVIVLLAVSLAVGLLVDRRWELLFTPWTVAGALVAGAVAAPNLVWQASNGWPQLEMAEALSDRLAAENRATLVPLQVLFFGPFVMALLWWGAGWLRRPSGGMPFRPLLWAWPAGLVLVFASGGRPYYAFPLTLAVGLAGVVAHEQREGDLRTLGWFAAANAVVSAAFALPILPVTVAGPVAAVNDTLAETVGWPELVAQVAAVVDSLPADEQDGVVLLSGSYGEAGAIDLYGPDHGLPPAYSAHNGYADFRQPTDAGATVVAVGYSAEHLGSFFEACTEVTSIEMPHDTANEAHGAPIVVCRGLVGEWEEAWERLRHLS